MAQQTALHFATDDHVKKTNIYMVPTSQLTADPDWNHRKDYGNAEEMAELMESIYSQGPRVPLRGFKDGDKYVVRVGHRRLRAAQMAKDKYGVDIIFGLLLYPVGASEKDMVFDTLLSNGGKDLNPLEKAETARDLVKDYGSSVKEISAALGGVSDVYVKNLLRLADVPEKAKKLIRNGVVSSTYVMGYLKNKNADMEALVQEIEAQAEGKKAAPKKSKKTKGKTAKVTKKDLEKESRAATSIGEFKRFRKNGAGVYESKEKQEAFEFFCSLVDNTVSYSHILHYFTGK